MSTESIPTHTLLTAAEDKANREREFAVINARLSTTLDELKVACKKEIRAAIDPKVFPEYEKAHDALRRRLADLEQTTHATTAGMEATARMRTELTAEARRMADKLGIDTRRIVEIQRDYNARARSAVESAFGSAEVAPDVELAPKPVTARAAVETRTPPYAGTWTCWWSYGTRGGQWVNARANRFSGEIDCWSSLWLYGADDSDYAYTHAYAEQQFWYRMPSAGLLEVELQLQSIDTSFGGCLTDEWGFSDANIQQLSSAYLWILSPCGSRRERALVDYRRGESEGCWSVSPAVPGGFRYAPLVSLDAYPAGTLLLCGVGVHDYNYLWVNDMSCRLYMTSRWFLRRVNVRSTGA